MKNSAKKIIICSIAAFSAFSCSKKESTATESAAKEAADYSETKAADSVSMAASQQIAGKKFVKTADIDMEVKDAYDATIFIEKQLKDLGGFVTESRLNSNVISEETYETSDTEATLVKKYQTDNRMQVRVPTEKLGDFLTTINDKKLFLNTRIIIAEDVTNNAKIAELEAKKSQKTGEVISQMKPTGEKAERTEANLQQGNENQIQSMKLEDDLKYSTVNIYIKEPKLRVAEIAVTNTKNIDNKYKFNFFYDLKNALVEGFYFVQKLIVAFAMLWPLWIIGAAVFYFMKIRSKKMIPKKTE